MFQNDVLRVELTNAGEEIDYKQDQFSLEKLNLIPTAEKPDVKLTAKCLIYLAVNVNGLAGICSQQKMSTERISYNITVTKHTNKK